MLTPIWCGRRDLNPHAVALAPKTNVSAIPPRPRNYEIFL